jgi:hypothetical protein
MQGPDSKETLLVVAPLIYTHRSLSRPAAIDHIDSNDDLRTDNWKVSSCQLDLCLSLFKLLLSTNGRLIGR